MSDQSESTTNVPELGCDALLSPEWAGKLTRGQALGILERGFEKDDPHWEMIVEEYYDDATDTQPSWYDVMAALGVTKEECDQAAGISCDNTKAEASPDEL